MGFADFFASSCETRELHRDTQLRTRYYRNRFDQCQAAIEKYAAQEKLKVADVNPVHREIYLVGSQYDCIVTVSQVTPIESGVDIKVNMAGSFGWGKPKKIAMALYKYLDSALAFKGVSLHP